MSCSSDENSNIQINSPNIIQQETIQNELNNIEFCFVKKHFSVRQAVKINGEIINGATYIMPDINNPDTYEVLFPHRKHISLKLKTEEGDKIFYNIQTFQVENGNIKISCEKIKTIDIKSVQGTSKKRIKTKQQKQLNTGFKWYHFVLFPWGIAKAINNCCSEKAIETIDDERVISLGDINSSDIINKSF